MSQAVSSVRRRWILVLVTLVFLLPAAAGFATKFAEFVYFVRQDEGAFTIVPIVNYVLATLGFLLMLVWATSQGMFRDLEKPKETMLEQERLLDQEMDHASR